MTRALSDLDQLAALIARQMSAHQSLAAYAAAREILGQGWHRGWPGAEEQRGAPAPGEQPAEFGLPAALVERLTKY